MPCSEGQPAPCKKTRQVAAGRPADSTLINDDCWRPSQCLWLGMQEQCEPCMLLMQFDFWCQSRQLLMLKQKHACCTWPDSLQLKAIAIVCQSEYDVQSVKNTTWTSGEAGASSAATIAEMVSSSCSSNIPALPLRPWRMARTRLCSALSSSLGHVHVVQDHAI